ncbi:DUF6503 family protein [Psychroserpens sp.]|uniref:DUF6503 family protein n=1 Tax=Psychroserpens sp. TaxID=2020870 RepID=UPI003C74079E
MPYPKLQHLIVFAILLLGCKQQKTKNSLNKTQTAQDIINQSILVSGGDGFSSSKIRFTFRDKLYMALRNKNTFQLERQFSEDSENSVSEIRDVLSNEGFKRYINLVVSKVKDSMASKYAASVNSVHYFSVLPFGLNDDAVKKERLENRFIKNKNYFSVEVTFKENGGGEDFEDKFIYWVNTETFKVDYLAYSYNEGDGKGMRFREAYNERYIEGLRFVDYNNYKPKMSSADLKDLPNLFESGSLDLLSRIELKQITVELLN